MTWGSCIYVWHSCTKLLLKSSNNVASQKNAHDNVPKAQTGGGPTFEVSIYCTEPTSTSQSSILQIGNFHYQLPFSLNCLIWVKGTVNGAFPLAMPFWSHLEKPCTVSTAHAQAQYRQGLLTQSTAVQCTYSTTAYYGHNVIQRCSTMCRYITLQRQCLVQYAWGMRTRVFSC